MQGVRFFNTVIIALVLCGGLAMESCRKPEIQSQTLYTFNNKTGQRITLDLYGSKTDYGTDSNRLQRDILEPGSSAHATLDVLKTYWIDWYNEDYSINNLQRAANAATPWPELATPIADDVQIDMRPSSFRDTIRSVLFNGHGTSSTWKGSLQEGTAWDGTHEFRFRKDQTCLYTFTNGTGAVSTASLTYNVVSVGASGLGTNLFQLQVTNAQASYNFWIRCTLWGSSRTGRDTMSVGAEYSGSIYEYVIIRK
jgi:hypothetical protein